MSFVVDFNDKDPIWNYARDWGAISEPVTNPWKYLEEKKEVTSEELRSKMETIYSSLIILLRSKGL